MGLTGRWIEEFLREGGFAMLLNMLKKILEIEWRYFPRLAVFDARDEKDDAVLHQILLCLKALSTTEVLSYTGCLTVGGSRRIVTFLVIIIPIANKQSFFG